jgi:hypothetical protein
MGPSLPSRSWACRSIPLQPAKEEARRCWGPGSSRVMLAIFVGAAWVVAALGGAVEIRAVSLNRCFHR